ncbi:MAG: hypothetical protein WBY94_20595 [Polyangiaceae bacterium]
MTPATTRRRARLVAFGIGAAVACTPTAPPNPSTVPRNVCPDYPCAAYAQDGGAACTAGACVDTAPVPTSSRLVLLVAVPTDAHVAPGVTFALSPDQASSAGVTVLQASLNSGRYLVTPTTISDLQTNTGVTLTDTSLPVHVTYRPLWPPGSPSPTPDPDAAAPLTDAVNVGLALYPIEADAVPASGFLSGPFGSPDVGFTTFVQASVDYERTLTPDPPWDQTFPPDVSRVAFVAGTVTEGQLEDEYAPDLTRKTEDLTATIPTFDLSRADGKSLDGWTAYLRDATTKRPISPIKPLSGASTPDGGLVLPTSHHPHPPDALSNAELVMAPGAGQSLPTAAFPAVAVLPRAETYPFVPNPVTVQGSIEGADGKPVPADVVFEATGIYALAPAAAAAEVDAGPPTDGGPPAGIDAGLRYPLQTQGFEYAAHASAQPDGGASVYSIVLPRGEYRTSVRPLDVPSSGADSGPRSHAVAVVEPFDTGQSDEDPIQGPSIALPVAPIVTGTAVIADGRPLCGASVEALPVHCARSMNGEAGSPLPDTPSCMPRYAVGQTASSDGSFALALDPGEYLVRVEPVDGTSLPWVTQAVSVPASAPIVVRIPAPVRRGLQLFGQDGVAITNALVRMFTMPPSGPAIELGRAVTDASGRFEMYIDPAAE